MYLLQSLIIFAVVATERGFGNEPNKDAASGGDQFRFTWPWRRKT
jgi:hypothetical protein